MDRHTCRLCFRRYQNGRALGGHMRSHVMAAAAAAAAYSPPPPQQHSPPLSLASTSSTRMDGGKPEQPRRLSSVPREDPVPVGSCKVRAPDFSGAVTAAAAGESSVVQDGESDTESPRGGTGFAVSRRRSKRARRRAPPPPLPLDPEPASSVSDATQEEDVAMSLVMLSRDSWARSRSEPEIRWARASLEAEGNNVFDEDEEETAVLHPPATAKHQCGACKKVFRSYQALGGHRASVKKGKGGCVPAAAGKAGWRAASDAPIVHECPFCFRVFGSGQALGGHKRSHMPVSGGALVSSSPSPAKCGDSSFGAFDLNVPAACDDDDFELSAVYDAEFGGAGQ